MKYLLMVQAKQSDYDAMRGGNADGFAWSETQLKTMFDFMGKISDDLAESGELVDAQGLVEPSRTRLVTGRKDGVPVVSDGPYGESKEVLAGYWVVDCVDIERATEIASRVTECPAPDGAPVYPVVVRAIQEGGGAEM